jgi:hypothetical protein
MPFILRGVTLAGIDSVMAPIALRRTAWERLARDLDPKALDLMTEEVPLERAIEKAEALMAGRCEGGSWSRPAAEGRLRRQRTSCSSLLELRMLAAAEPFEDHHLGRHDVGAHPARALGGRQPVVRMARADRIGDPLSPNSRLSSRPATVCMTQTWASQPATTKVLRPRGMRDRNPSRRSPRSGTWRAWCRRARDLGHQRPEPVGVLLGADDVDAELARRRAELDAAPDHRLGVVDRRHQARLRIDDQESAVGRIAEQAIEGSGGAALADFPPWRTHAVDWRQFAAKPPTGDKPCR